MKKISATAKAGGAFSYPNVRKETIYILELRCESASGRTVSFIAPDDPADVPDYLLTGWDGGHGLAADIKAYAQYLQHGTTYEASQIGPRDILIRGRVMGDVVKNRIALLEAMSPLEAGTLTLIRGDFIRKINYRVQQAPSCAQQNGWMFSQTLYCPGPFWEGEKDGETDVAGWEPMFEWPLDVPISDGVEEIDEGVIFGQRTESAVVNVYNYSDIPIGMQITFVALGDVINPSLINVLDETIFIKANISMKAGDRIEINTEPRMLSATFISGGVKTNAYPLMDPYSNLAIRLKKEDNLFRYDAESGKIMLDVRMRYKLQYLGV